MYQEKSFQSYRGSQSSHKQEGVATFVFKMQEIFPREFWWQKSQTDWTNIDQVMILCTKWHFWGLKGNTSICQSNSMINSCLKL